MYGEIYISMMHKLWQLYLTDLSPFGVLVVREYGLDPVRCKISQFGGTSAQSTVALWNALGCSVFDDARIRVNVFFHSKIMSTSISG